ALYGSVTLGNGQFCTNPGLVFVPEVPGLDAFLARYRKLAEANTGAPLLNRGIAAAYEAGVEQWKTIDALELLVHPETGDDAPNIGATPALARIAISDFRNALDQLQREVFGPSTLIVVCPGADAYQDIVPELEGQLSASLHGDEDELNDYGDLLEAMTGVAGRVIINGFPTGIEVCHAMQHGGPYPATTDSHHTSIGTAAIARWGRPICYQSVPDALLPDALKEANPLGILRLVDGAWTKDPS
ncbi:MAG: aldehyde dehydrogenase (NADP(+)), partial [Verrucomicrobiota bacterium]